MTPTVFGYFSAGVDHGGNPVQCSMVAGGGRKAVLTLRQASAAGESPVSLVPKILLSQWSMDISATLSAVMDEVQFDAGQRLSL